VRRLVSSEVSGQACALTVMTPIADSQQEALTAYLERLRDDGERGPLARLGRTHFGRWVIVPGFVPDDVPNADVLASPHLLFTACFDGDVDSYLDELGSTLAEESQEIWGRCAGAPAPATGAALKRYLLDHRIKTGFFVAAYGEATVPRVRAALAQRDALIAFATDAQAMDPATLQQAFLERLGR
jgi:hypothetical protein